MKAKILYSKLSNPDNLRLKLHQIQKFGGDSTTTEINPKLGQMRLAFLSLEFPDIY